MRWFLVSTLALLSVIAHAFAQQTRPVASGSLVVEKRSPSASSIKVIDASTIVVSVRRWHLKGFRAPRIDKARCLDERVRAVDARLRLEELLVSAHAEIALFPVGRFEGWQGRARLTIDGQDVGPILIGEQVAVMENMPEHWGCPKPEPIPPVPHDAEIVKEKTVVIKETVVVIVKEPSDTVAAARSGCAWVRGYTRGDGTEVKAHQRCAMR
jgi:hypothetical protein